MTTLSKFVLGGVAVLALAGGTMLNSAPAQACGSEPYMGEICTFGYVRGCPYGFMPADGTLLDVNRYTALFSLIGNVYGGDGKKTFALPDLRGRAVTNSGLTSVIPNYPVRVLNVGDKIGLAQTQLVGANLPPIQSTGTADLSKLTASGNVALNTTAAGTYHTLANGDTVYLTNGSAKAPSQLSGLYTTTAPGATDTAKMPVSVTLGGGSAPVPVTVIGGANAASFPNIPPELAVTQCIAIDGIYPIWPQ